MGIRRQARESALQALFMCDSLKSWDLDTIELCFSHFVVPRAVLPYAKELCVGVLDNLVDVDSKISCASEHWSLNRMARVDRAILRVAAYELTYSKEVPVNVAIDEAIEIAKRFGSDNSSTFVNGVLDRVASQATQKVEFIREEPKEAEETVFSTEEESAERGPDVESTG